MDEESTLRRLEEEGENPPRIRLRPADEEETDAPTPPDGRRYEVRGEIGRGGVGVVYRGHDADLGRDVAMKVLREEHLRSAETVRRFVEEARIEGRLQHPGVVPVYELGLRADERPYFTMKLVKGETFATTLGGRRDRSDGRRRVLSIFEQICRTVAYAHACGVVHRDLKPANVLIGRFGEVQVVDWGFAKVLAKGEQEPGVEPHASRPEGGRPAASSSTESIASEVMGTPAYMPPEQAQGRTHVLDERADVFALGAILCEILTGEPPYVRDRGDVMRQAARGRLDDAFARLDACDADRALIVLATRSLAPSPGDRPRDAGEIADGVGEHLVAVEERAHRSRLHEIEERDRAARAREKAEAARVEAAEQRHARRQTLALAAAIVVAILVATGAWLRLDAGRRERSRRATRAAEEVLQEASRLRGEKDWAAATAAAERARELARAEGVAAETRRQAEGLLEQIQDEASEARRLEAQRARDRAVRTRLEENRLRRDVDPATRDAVYAAAFREDGIDVERLAPATAAAEIGVRTWPTDLVAALDAWAILRRREKVLSRDPGSLVAVARVADPEPTRNRIRDLATRGRLEECRQLAGELNGSSPVATLVLLAAVLAEADDHAAVVKLLRPTQIHHPSDLWLNVLLAQSLARLDPPDHEGSRWYWTAATALRPDSVGVTWNLAVAQFEAGDREAAAATWRVLGSKLVDRERFEEAIAALEKAEITLGAEEADPRVGLYLALANAKLGKTADARAWYAKGVARMAGKEVGRDETRRVRAEVESLMPDLRSDRR